MSQLQTDTIHINFKRYSLYSYPLEQYWQLHNNKPPLFSTTSGNNRGYRAEWLIENYKLYLIKFWGEALLFPGYKVYDIYDLFPNHPNRVFAEWYTGSLSVGIGQRGESLLIEQYEIKADICNGIITNLAMHDMV
ncbi:MAG: hypothetical protein JSU03_03195 [Bacteroidetes bacterium]|nr:hypothetical protein [Bacteroidota bacterium]MBS1756262.1 hypothetical protein [Bacteroidota bacterium]